MDPGLVETNIVIFGCEDASGLAGRLHEAGVEVSPLGPDRLRMVTHLDVDRAGCERAVAAVHEALGDAVRQ